MPSFISSIYLNDDRNINHMNNFMITSKQFFKLLADIVPTNPINWIRTKYFGQKYPMMPKLWFKDWTRSLSCISAFLFINISSVCLKQHPRNKRNQLDLTLLIILEGLDGKIQNN